MANNVHFYNAHKLMKWVFFDITIKIFIVLRIVMIFLINRLLQAEMNKLNYEDKQEEALVQRKWVLCPVDWKLGNTPNNSWIWI